jgi:hypothetical protein
MDKRISAAAVGYWTSKEDQATPSNESVQGRLREYKRMRITTSCNAADALEDYLSTDLILDLRGSNSEGPHFDVLQYWFDRRHAQPELARFAFDTLAIPLMSDSPERAFSAGRDPINYRRSELKADVVEACSFLRSLYGPLAAKTIDGEIYAAFDDEEVIEKQYEKLYTQKGLQTDEIGDDLYE